MGAWGWWAALAVLAAAVALSVWTRRAQRPPVAIGVVVDQRGIAITVDGRPVAETAFTVGPDDLVRLVPFPGEPWSCVVMVGDLPVLQWTDVEGLVRQ